MIVAIALPALIGFSALGVETGLWYNIKLKAQSAADAAAISATYQVLAGQTDIIRYLAPAASEAAAQNGYSGETPEVIYPYNDNVVSNGIAVILQQTQTSFLAAMFVSHVTVNSKAVAVVTPFDNPCILALGTSSTDVEIGDSISLSMEHCSIAANSTSSMAIEIRSNTSYISASTVFTAGELSLQGHPVDPTQLPSGISLGSPARIGFPVVVDPYATTLTHAFLTGGMPATGYCMPPPSGNGNCVIPGLNILPGNTVDLAPGIYRIAGDLNIAGALSCSACDNTRGIGVTLILTTAQTGKIGALNIDPSATVSLNAPGSGRFAGLVLVQDANTLPPGTTYTSTHSQIVGGTGATLNGLVYFPKSSLTFQGHPSPIGPKCLVLLVDRLSVSGNSNLESTGCTSIGLANLPIVYTVALAE